MQFIKKAEKEKKSIPAKPTKEKSDRKLFSFKNKKKNVEKDNKDSELAKDLNIFSNIAKEKDVFSPTLIREVDKKDKIPFGKRNFNDYMVEVGTTIGFNRYFRSFFGKMMAENTHFGMFDDLYLGGFGDADCDVAIHVSRADDSKTRYLLSRKIAGLEADLQNEKDTIKIKQLRDQLAELHGQEERLRKNIEQLYHVSIQATVSSDSLEKLKKFSNAMIKRLSNQGVFLRSADTKQLPALLAMTPFDNTKHDFKHTFKNAETSNVADMFPFGFGSISHTTGVIIGEDIYGKPVYYNDRHPRLQNYNSVTFGVSGSGKSMKTKVLNSRKAYQGDKTRTGIIDFELENKDWILELGFPYIEFSTTDSLYSLNIFPIPRVVVSRNSQKYADIDDAVNTVFAVVTKMLKIATNQTLMGSKQILLKEAIQDCYNVCGITYNPESIYEDSNMTDSGIYTLNRQFKPMPQLITLYEVLGQQKYSELQEERKIVKSFTKAGNIKSQAVFDCQTNVNLQDNIMIGMSVNGLDDVMKPIGLYVASSNLWSTYERLPKAIKKDIIIDEAQNMMQEDYEATVLENWCRIARRRNIGIHPITQGFEVFLRKQQGFGILKNASTKFLFRQDALDIEAIEGKFNLPDGAKLQLLNFEAGECIMIVGNEMILMKTKPMPNEYELFSTNPNEEGEV
ncbi:VirB4 family type IV secretion system protein [Thermotalea metallivorans]|uniref:TraG P-loop domain-containing protein n=1 Tax=Thermotalea metallivorans TaxID=520762 RepID=A0A140KZJ2_9FIRM|nr:hypothetical protein [Thermotalea metallivorans]KXG73717.1 hypothetical protein AN619_29490 [Thermotalea metallivorans]